MLFRSHFFHRLIQREHGFRPSNISIQFSFRLRLIPLMMLMQVVANQSLQLIPFFAQIFKGVRLFLRGV